MRVRPSVKVSRFGLVVVLLAASLALVACGGEDAETSDVPATVTTGPRTTEIRGNKFESPMKVAVGSQVTWVNSDSIPHNVIADEGSFRSDTLEDDDTFVHTFDTAGRFEYTCTFHPGMDGVVEVE
jgi:plastocyanin